MKDSTKLISRSDVLSVFRSDIARYLLPPDVVRKYTRPAELFLGSLSIESIQQRRAAIRGKLNTVFENVLTGKYEPPLSAYLRELPDEIVYFYIDRIHTLEVEMARAAHLSTELVPTPPSWKEFWLRLLTQRLV